MTLRPLLTERWTVWHVVAGAVMAVLGILVTLPAWLDIQTIAMKDEEYSHILLVPLVAGWLIWIRRARFRHCRPRWTILGPAVLGLGWAIHSFGFYYSKYALWQGGAVLVVLGCVLSVFGKDLLFRFFPAIAVLVFLVPAPGMLRQQISLPLQTGTAAVSFQIMELTGFDVARAGNVLSVNGRPVTVAEGCNGMRGVFPLILVSYAFAFGMPLRNGVRVALLLLSPLAAIGCNVVRVLATAIVYGYSNWEVGESFHYWTGWAMLPLAFGLLYLIIWGLRWAMIPVTRYPLAMQSP